jgi:hypothetical protein
MEALFPAAGKIEEYDAATNKLINTIGVTGYLYGLEYFGLPNCTYAAVSVGPSVESVPSIVCVVVGTSNSATVTTLAKLPAGGTQTGGEYSIVSSGTFSDHAGATTSKGSVYYVAAHSHGDVENKGKGANSAIFSIALPPQSSELAKAVYEIPMSEWCNKSLVQHLNQHVIFARYTDAS